MILLTTAACSQNPDVENGFAGTQAAFDLQSTQIAQKIVEDTNATQIALGVQATVIAQQAAELTAVAQEGQSQPTELQIPASTLPPPPTNTPPPPPTETDLPTDIPPTPTPDFEAG
jgi:hypothetical protein